MAFGGVFDLTDRDLPIIGEEVEQELLGAVAR